MLQRTVFINKIRMLQRTQSKLDSFFNEADKRPPTDCQPGFFMIFIKESWSIFFTKERLFMLFKFTCTVYKS